MRQPRGRTSRGEVPKTTCPQTLQVPKLQGGVDLYESVSRRSGGAVAHRRCNICRSTALPTDVRCPACSFGFPLVDADGRLIHNRECAGCHTLIPDTLEQCYWCATPAVLPSVGRGKGRMAIVALVVLLSALGLRELPGRSAEDRSEPEVSAATARGPVAEPDTVPIQETAAPAASMSPSRPGPSSASSGAAPPAPPVAAAPPPAAARAAPASPAPVTPQPAAPRPQATPPAAASASSAARPAPPPRSPSAAWGPARIRSAVNLRAAPDLSARILRTLPGGTGVEAGPDQWGWREVQAGELRGWVGSRFVTAAPQAP
jgi:hypothetical protein